jgi:Tol biopolymer transport system component/DNA-binding winged helix-turn-helix (wHTH) protein
VEKAIPTVQVIHFATFEVDLRTGEVRKGGVKLKLSGQPFQVLAILLERPGEVVTRDELQKRLWPATFVDVDHNLNTAINKIREVLGDTAENPRFVETLPRRGYRFIAPVDGNESAARAGEDQSSQRATGSHSWAMRLALAVAACLILAGAGWIVYMRRHAPAPSAQKSLTRLTFDDGLQIGATWSPDAGYIAYSSDRGGKFDIWVQHLSGGEPMQVTRGPGEHWQPAWSPDGRYIAYRSEEEQAGVYIVPALGGSGRERKISSFGYYPRWSPDSSRILFRTTQFGEGNRFYVVDLDGNQPREVLTQFLEDVQQPALAVAWHPDGKRVSVLLGHFGGGLALWTGPLDGSAAGVRSEISPAVAKQLAEVGSAGILAETLDSTFSWAPSGGAIYCQLGIRGVQNLWKLVLDPETLRITAMERLTTSPGPDGGLAVSRDGKKLAFTAELQQIRTWLYPFDAGRGRITGGGQAVSPAGMSTWYLALSQDGTRMAFGVNHAGKFELWERLTPGGNATPIVVDDYLRDFPSWSPDGKQLAYQRFKLSPRISQVVVWSDEDRTERPIGDTTRASLCSWSTDGKSFLVWELNPKTDFSELAIWPLAAAPHAERAGRKIAVDPAYNLWQPQMSPDGRWIVFEAAKDLPETLESTLWVVPTSGGNWTKITDGSHWDDKPRWSADGKTIYFVSGRSGFFNVWGVRFDPAQGKAVGDAFPVTSFNTPALMIPQEIPHVDFAVSRDRLAFTLEQVSGGIWLLDNVDR